MAATGHADVIDYLAPEPRPWATALDNYLPLNTEARWRNGLTWTPWGCDEPEAIPLYTVCEDGHPDRDPDFVAPSSFDSFPVFYPFEMQFAIDCSTLGGQGVNAEKLTQYAMDVTRSARGYLLARQVAFGDPEETNSSLDEADDVTLAGETSAASALVAVEEALATRLKGAQGMVHMSPGVLAQVNAGGMLSYRGDTLYTPSGHVVVADGGYAGAGYIFGSSPVRFVMDPVTPVSAPWENFDWERNIHEVQVHTMALALWEPCASVRATVDLTPA